MVQIWWAFDHNSGVYETQLTIQICICRVWCLIYWNSISLTAVWTCHFLYGGAIPTFGRQWLWTPTPPHVYCAVYTSFLDPFCLQCVRGGCRYVYVAMYRNKTTANIHATCGQSALRLLAFREWTVKNKLGVRRWGGLSSEAWVQLKPCWHSCAHQRSMSCFQPLYIKVWSVSHAFSVKILGLSETFIQNTYN